MDILNKLALNNNIVLMRKLVRQAKIHSINKLTREIKKLKKKKGTEEQKAKNVRKAERYGEEILIMKKIPDDEVSRFALMNERSMVEITNDITESLKNKSLARLAYHKSVEEKVKEFRMKYPNWKKTIGLLMETLGEKYKYKKNKKANLGKRKTQSNNSFSSHALKQDNENATINNSSGTWKVESVKSNQGNQPKFIKMQEIMNTNQKTQPDQTVETVHKNYNNDANEKTKNNPKAHDICKQKQNIQLDGKKNTLIKVNKTKESDNKSVEKLGMVDSFFLKKDHTEYISVSAGGNIENNPQNQHYDFNSSSLFSLNKQSKPRFMVSNFKSQIPKIEDIPSKIKKYSDEKFVRSCQKFEDTNLKSLHPSWEAKKKQSQVVKFQGTKIKFDDC